MALERFHDQEVTTEREDPRRGPSRHGEEEALEQRVFERTAELASVNRQLSREIADRKRAEREIADLNGALELRVSQRTTELLEANRALEREVAEHKQSVDDLLLSEERFRGLVEERDKLLEELRSAVAVRDEFLSIASHEFKTPVTALQLQLQALLTGLEKRRREPGPAGLAITDDRLEARLRFAQRQVQRLTRLVDSLLDITHLATGEMDVELEELDVGVVLAEVIERYQAELRSAGCTVRLERGPSLTGHYDRLRLEQIFSTLLSNAVKFGARRPVQIGVTSDGDTVEVRVRDEGIGVLAEDRERIFDRFARAVSGRNYGGFGMGLWIARQAARALGGEVRIEASTSAGASFLVTLPRSGRPARDEETATPPNPMPKLIPPQT